MDFVWEFFLGVATAIFGLIAPGMLNMTALKISINVDRISGIKFSTGAVLIIFFQALIGVMFAKWLSRHEEVILLLKQLGIAVFYILAIYFFYLAYKNSKPGTNLDAPKGNYFWRGLGMSALNMLSIPFYLAMGLVYSNKGWVQTDALDALIFCLGAGVGSLGIFWLYLKFSNFIKNRVSFIAQNINVILGVIFVIIASSTLYNLYLS
ncbi:MAG: LysE family translocator [Flavobacteriaceae bacterium]